MIAETYHQLFWMILSCKMVIVGITWDKFLNFQNHQLSDCTTEAKVFHLKGQGPKIWNMLPDDWKDIDNLHTFKNKVKKWIDKNCPCRLCKIYINKGKKAWKRKKSLGYSSSIFGIMAVAYQHRFTINKFKLPFFTFLTVYF